MNLKGVLLMKTSRVIAKTLFLFVTLFGLKLEAQEVLPHDPYSGDSWTRSTLSGD